MDAIDNEGNSGNGQRNRAKSKFGRQSAILRVQGPVMTISGESIRVPDISLEISISRLEMLLERDSAYESLYGGSFAPPHMSSVRGHSKEVALAYLAEGTSMYTLYQALHKIYGGNATNLPPDYVIHVESGHQPEPGELPEDGPAPHE